MNLGDLIISPFITTLVLLYKVLETLPERMPGLNTVLAIALFGILIRLITFPLALRRQKSIEKMQEIQPRLDSLRRKYANEPEKLAQARMVLYREAGINPLSGCLLSLIQLPFIFGIYWAVTAALGGEPYRFLNLHGRVLIPGLSGEIPLPNQFLWLNLAQPDLVLAVLVAATTFIQQRLSASDGGGQVASKDWFRTYGIPLILGLIAFRLASGLSIFLVFFNLTSIAQYAAVESVGLRNLFLGRERTRRWQLGKALRQRTLGARQFEKLVSSLLRPPTLTPEDVTLSYKLLELGAHSFNESWPVDLAKKAGDALSQLSSSGDTRYDLTALYHKFAEGCAKFGHKELAADLAARGYACPQGGPASKTACVLLLARSEQVDERAKNIYKAFLADHPPESQTVQRFARIFWDKGAITPDMDAAKVKQRLPLNACIANLLPGKPYSWAKCNLGLAYLILDEAEKAIQYFQEALASNALDSIAAQGLAIVLFQKGQYDESLQVVQDARQAGLVEDAIDAIGRLCQAARWLANVQVEALELEQIEMWYAQLQVSFPLRRFLTPGLDFVQGQLAAITGDWQDARQYLQAAYNTDKRDIRFAYHYAQLLQVSGEWKISAEVLKGKRADAPELLCLRLKQARHDVGLDQLGQELLQFTSEPDAQTPKKRLASAKYALLAGQPADILPWPASLAFASPAQADAWAGIWLAALIGRAATDEAKQEIRSRQFSRLPKPEQSLFEAAVKWLSGDLVGAARDLEKTLEIVPNHENALRLSAAIAEAQGNSPQAYQILERLQQVAPNDHSSALRGALLRWQKGEQEAAVAHLQKLLPSPKIAPLAKFWLGRFLLIRATELREPQGLLQQAGDYLIAATEAGIPEAPWYNWLCEARKEYDPKGGWSQRKARRLLKTLPGPLSAIPITEVAAVAALVAIETNNPPDMLDGCTSLLSLLRDKRDEEILGSVSLDNLAEALWRTATTVTSLDDQLALSKLAHEIGESSAEHGQIARQVTDATLMNTIIAMAQSGENIDEALVQVDEAVKMTPEALMPRLARTSLLIKKGEMTAQEAIAYLNQESQQSIAQALEECVQLAADSQSVPTHPAGLAAFLTVNKASLPGFASTLHTLSEEAIRLGDETSLLEMARCMAVAGMHDDAIDLFTRAYEANHSKAVAEEFSDYLCHVAAQSGPTDAVGTSVDLEKAQRLLSLAYTCCKEGT